MEAGNTLLGFLTKHIEDILNFVADGFKLEGYMELLHDAKENLTSATDDKDNEAKDAQAQKPGIERTKEFLLLLNRARELIREAEQIEKDCEKMDSRCVSELTVNIFTRHSLSRRALNTTEKMKAQWSKIRSNKPEDKVNMFRTLPSSSAAAAAPPPIPSTDGSPAPVKVAEKDRVVASEVAEVVVRTSMDVLVDQLWDLVREDKKVGFVGVHGMPGVGKTKLLTDLEKRFSSQTHGFKVMMIQVGETVSVEKIQKDMMQKMKLPSHSQNERKRAEEIFRAITEKQRYVILLDDVWESPPLGVIGIPNPKDYPQCCKVIVGTRLLDVCADADAVVKVNCLSWEESWALFQQHGGGEKLLSLFSSKPEIEAAAKDIAGKCEGLPLALTNIAQSMSTVKSAKVWKKNAKMMEWEPWKISEEVEYVFYTLKRSYDNLRDEKLRTAFEYFTFYPKGYATSRKWFTHYWIGECIIDGYIDLDEAHHQRNRIIEALEKACLLEGMKLHGMLYAMACWVGSDCGQKNDRWLVQPGAGLSEAPPAERWRETVRVSLLMNNIPIWPDRPDSPNLVSMILWKSLENRRFSDGFFSLMASLRVLEMSSSYLEELPSSIGELHALRYLDVSNSNLVSLPKEMGRLRKLKFLNLQKTYYLKTIPSGVFEGLEELEVLWMHESYSSWGHVAQGARSEELAELTKLLEVEISVDKMEALQVLVASPRFSVSTQSLDLRDFKGTRTIQLPRDLGSGMKKCWWVRISDCMDLEELVLGGSEGEETLEGLQTLLLLRLDRVRIVWRGLGPRECLRNLSELNITKCGQIEELVGGANANEKEGDVVAFPNLRILYLIELPKLRSICRYPLAFPSLRKLWVDKCPNVKRLPFGAHSGKNLSVIWGSRQWWDGLEWGSRAVKSTFEPFFTEW